MDYIATWKTHKQILLITCFAVTIFFAVIIAKNVQEGLFNMQMLIDFAVYWVVAVWCVASLITVFAETNGVIPSAVRSIFSGMFSGMFSIALGATIMLFFSLIKIFFGLGVIGVLIIIYFLIYPFVTIYYYIRYRIAKKQLINESYL